MAYIDVKHVSKIYGSGEQEVRANDDINFEIKKGELTIIVGASGAGKSTLLNILGGMDTPTKGDVIINGKIIANDSPKQLTTYRRLSVGFVFQFYNLIPNLTALENVELASQISPDSLDVPEVMK
ncbi:macrolide ABC transporter ATP-binding protein, partial [Streptococcus sp. KR]